MLLALHRVEISTLRRGFVWERITIPSFTPTGELIFRPLSALAAIPFDVESGKPFAPEPDGTVVGVDDEMSIWENQNKDGMVVSTILELLVGMAILELKKNKPVLTFSKPADPEELTFSSLVFDFFNRRLAIIPFGDGLEHVLAAKASKLFLNRRHPLIEWLLKHQESTAEKSNFSFLHSLAGALLEEGAIEALATGDFGKKRHNLHFSNLGYYFRNANLEELDDAMRPPYQCWHPDYGKFTITIETLDKLAEVQAIDWHRKVEERYI